jgi:hypothetical protein
MSWGNDDPADLVDQNALDCPAWQILLVASIRRYFVWRRTPM